MIVALHDDHCQAIEAWVQHAMTPIRRTLSRISAPERAVFINACGSSMKRAVRLGHLSVDLPSRRRWASLRAWP